MSIDTTIRPTIHVPREGRTMSEAVKFVGPNFPGAMAVSLEEFSIVIHFGETPAEPTISTEEANKMAESILADYIGGIDAARDRANFLSILTPAERQCYLDSERRAVFTVGNIYQDCYGASLVLHYQEAPKEGRSFDSWTVTTVPVREILPGVWRRFGKPTTHSTYPSYNAKILPGGTVTE